MIDALGQQLSEKDIVGRLGNKSISLARVIRFTPKKVQIVYPVMKFDYATGTNIPGFSDSLVYPYELLRVAITPEVQAKIDEDKL